MSDLNETLPDDFEGRAGLAEKFGTVADLATSYQALQGQMGGSARVPGEDASPEDWRSFYTKMGAPVSVEGYGVPEDMDAGTKSQLVGLRQQALDSGLTSKQWDSLIGTVATGASSQIESHRALLEATKEEWATQSRKKYGDQFDSKLAMAERTYRHIVGDDAEVGALLESTGLNKNPRLLDLFMKVGEQMADDTIPADAGGAPQGNANSLAMRARKLLKEGAVNNPRHPDYEEAYQEYMRIQSNLMEQGFAGITDPRLKETQEFPLYEDV